MRTYPLSSCMISFFLLLGERYIFRLIKILFQLSIHPSIIYFAFEARWGLLVPIPADSGREAGCILRSSPNASQSKHIVTNIYSQSHPYFWVFLESPINLIPIDMSLDCGRKQQFSEKTHADTGITCKHHIEIPQPNRDLIQEATVLLCCPV